MGADREIVTPGWGAVAEAAESRAHAWMGELQRASEGRASKHGDLLSGVRDDTEGVEFTRKLLDLVVGADDAFVSAVGMREASQEMPASLPARDRLAVRAGGLVSLGLPWAVLPVARKWLRDRVGHLVLAARLPENPEKLGRVSSLKDVLRRHTQAGLAAEFSLLGDPVHGPTGAEKEVRRLVALAAVPGVTHISFDPARIVPGASEWSFEDDVAEAARALRPVFEAALRYDTVVTLEPQSVLWARRVFDVLVRGLADSALDSVRVGVRLFADLPESREMLGQLSRWAQSRLADGGAPIEVIIGASGAAGPERIASIQSGLAVPVIEGGTKITAQVLRLADIALERSHIVAMRPVIASESPYVLAAVAELAEEHGAGELYSVRLRAGVSQALAELIATKLPDVRVRVPVTAPQEFRGAAETIIGLAAEAADPESDLAQFARMMGENSDDGRSEATERFHTAVSEIHQAYPTPHRTQLRAREWDPSERDNALFYRPPDEPSLVDTGGLTAAVLGLNRGETGELRLMAAGPTLTIPVISSSGFANEPETDASLAPNREWARSLLRRAGERAVINDDADATVALTGIERPLEAEAVVAEAFEVGRTWSAQPHTVRATRLRRTALGAVAARDRLIETLAVDTGAPIAEIDAQVGGIVDAARYSAQLAEGLSAVRGATFRPTELMLVAADTYASLAEQAESVLAALAAGSAVLWALPPRFSRSAAVLIEEWEAAGLLAGVVRVMPVVSDATVASLAAQPEVSRATVLGARAEALALVKRRPDLRVEGRFRTVGSIVVTASADFDSAVEDIVISGLSSAGASLRAAHAVIMQGSVARSQRFRERLADAVRAIRVGDTTRPGEADPLGFTLGPLAAPLDEAGRRALTELSRGEDWLVQPRQLDESGRLWSPGVRTGVDPDSQFWADSRGVPVIGLTQAHTLSEAVQLQDRIGGGAVAGLQSLDADEILPWLDRAEAASLVVNRPTTRAQVERHPSGAWNAAVMGLPALDGGPNRLATLGSWEAREGTRSQTLHLRGLDPEVQLLIETAQASLGYEEFDLVRRGALADALAWRTSLGVTRDTIGLGIERNVLRHWPVETQVRLAEGGVTAHLLRVVAAALLVRAPISVSTGEVLPPEVTAYLAKQSIEVSLERDDDWLERISGSGPTVDGVPALRVRLIDGDRVRAAEWMGGLDRAALWAEPVTMAGPVELMSLLREQAISVRAHRQGMAAPVPGIDEWLTDPSSE
ncbi:MAG: aldehyde dehydrogenase family protein [Leucobacter sp.]